MAHASSLNPRWEFSCLTPGGRTLCVPQAAVVSPASYHIDTTSRPWSRLFLGLIAVGSLALVFFHQAPISQRPEYHKFADTRPWFGIPNAGDVLTNIAFLIPGLLGSIVFFRSPPSGARWSWVCLFAGTTLVAFGSAFYHWNPENWTLLWDRLPMAISFMGLFTGLLCENVFPHLFENALLIPLQTVGIGSVLYWYAVDDLRFYLWVQFFPLLCIVLIPFLFRMRYSHSGTLFCSLGLYVLAKVVEINDRRIYESTMHLISGHSAKHLLAGLAAFLLFLMIRNRKLMLQIPKSSLREGD